MSPTTLLSQLRLWIRSRECPAPGDHILCAVSGGSDSVGLLHALRELADEVGYRLTAGHFDHGLRGTESERDRRFVEALCANLGLSCHVGRPGDDPAAAMAPAAADGSMDATGDSPEALARTARRAFLTRTAETIGANRIALGHTLDDQAETVLMRVLIGTSITGLGAMRHVSRDGTWIRPFLGTRRRDIRHYLRRDRIAWVEDSTNRSARFPRNRLRTEILPLIAARVGDTAVDALSRLAEEARDVDDWLDAQARRLLGDRGEYFRGGRGNPSEIHLETGRLATYDPVLRRYALRIAYEKLRHGRIDLTRRHLESLEQLVGRSGELHLPGGIRAVGEHGRIRLMTSNAPAPPTDNDSWGPLELAAPGSLELPWCRLRIETALLDRRELGAYPSNDEQTVVFDHDRVSGPLTVRSWEQGDRFTPMGMKGTRKLSDLFTDRKVPRSERGRVPIVSDERGILWVVGHRRSDRAPVSQSTHRILRVAVDARRGGRTGSDTGDDNGC